MSEQDKVELCTGLQHLLNHAYAGSVGMWEGQQQGLRLPSGEIITKDFGLMLVNKTMLSRISQLNQEPEAHLYFVSAQVEEQIEKNLFCLCVGVQRSSTSMEYLTLAECQLIPTPNV